MKSGRFHRFMERIKSNKELRQQKGDLQKISDQLDRDLKVLGGGCIPDELRDKVREKSQERDAYANKVVALKAELDRYLAPTPGESVANRQKRLGLSSSVEENYEKYYKKLRSKEEELESLENFQGAILDKDKGKALLEAYGLEKKEIDNSLETLEAGMGGNTGDIILRGIAGKENWEMVEDLMVGDNVVKGVKNGVILKGSLAVGNVIGTSINRYANVVFGEGLGKFESLIGYIYRWFFHSGCKPFAIEEITSWKDLIGNDLREIEMMLKSAERNDSRGRAEVLRQVELGENKEDNGINLWQDFVEDLAGTCEELAEEITSRKDYYAKKDNGFGVRNCADRLKTKLLKLKYWFLSVNSLKEFSNIAEIKSIIPAMKKSLDVYFKNLSDQIKPLIAKKADLGIGKNPVDNKASSYGSGGYADSSTYPEYMPYPSY